MTVKRTDLLYTGNAMQLTGISSCSCVYNKIKLLFSAHFLCISLVGIVSSHKTFANTFFTQFVITKENYMVQQCKTMLEKATYL